MQPGNVPESYSDFLALVSRASIVSFFRPLGVVESDGTVDLTIDDFAADRRSCVSLRMASASCGTVEVKTLLGYDKTRNRWTDYFSYAANADKTRSAGAACRSRGTEG